MLILTNWEIPLYNRNGARLHMKAVIKKKGARITLDRAPDGSFYGTISGTNEEMANAIMFLGEAIKEDARSRIKRRNQKRKNTS